MLLNVHFPHIAPRSMELLRPLLDANIQITSGEQLPDPAAYEILVDGRPTQELIDASPNLHTLVIPWAGLPDTNRDLLAAYPHLAVHNLHHNAAMTAEHAVMLLLAAARFLLPMDRGLRAHDWTMRYAPSLSVHLAGKCALILGFGQVGRRVARVCRALDMEVLGVRRRAQAELEHPVDAEIHAPHDLDKILPRAQALIITLPLTAETKGLIGESQLALMPPGGLLVNVGRGLIVDQAALYEALRSGHLRAAGIDTWYNYPASPEERQNTPPADYPFHELENVVMTPHSAWHSTEAEALRMTHLAQSLNAAARGEVIPGRMDLQAGY
jgi:phosphoglycerate dehydrogenase-like enzyme